jgi:ADP-ribose pyrophosphatase
MEISDAYQFCPLCGEGRKPTGQSRPFRCHACQYTSFFGPVTAVGGVITNSHNEVLLIERAREPGKGKLGMPGGFVDANESAEVALRREIFEEVGLQVGEFAFLMTAPNSYSYQGVVTPVLDIFFHAKIEANQNVAAEATEVSAWMWTIPDRDALDRMAFESNRKALEQFLNRPAHR